MAPISNTWPDVQLSLELLPVEFADRVTSLVEWLTPHFANIETYAKDLHPQKRSCRIVKENYTWGQSFVVFEIVFEGLGEETGDACGDQSDVAKAVELGEQEKEQENQEEESWIIRFGMRPMDAYFNTAAQLERKILNEVAALHLVRTRTAIPVPQIIAYHPVAGDSDPLEHQQPRGAHPLGPAFPAFVLMTAIRGITIEDCGIAIHELGHADPNSDPLQGNEAKRPILKQYLRDIADMHVQLSKITFDKIGGFVMDKEGNVTVGPGADFGLGPFESAKEYFGIQAEAYERLAEAASDAEEEENGDGAAGGEDGEKSAESLKRRFVASLWRTAMMPLVDERDAGGPFPMRHGDLHSENILVDETGHIVGVLDWDCAATVPWEAFAVPTFEVSGHFGETKNEPKQSSAAPITAKQEKQELASSPTGDENQEATDDDSSSELSSSEAAGQPRRSHKRNLSRPQVHEEFNKALVEIELQSSASPTADSDSQAPSPSLTPVPLAETTELPQPPPVTASGRSLAALHDSDAGYVGAYLAYWMYSLACDYEETGRALHRILVARGLQNSASKKDENEGDKVAECVMEGDMEEAFRKFVRQVRGEAAA
ncbi:hypothetical protein P691DRAFT_813175 [Macrolepiota fuliginosa MF-IS2]|uniref:Aminoglycoside phosphotransferase domain-containing protein n=1 Tax=Macrolepiota fuliginosa MF-IS2 TaxID=1400762 RepID=A0A9P5XFX6_9AGAR|nr:hypothetical protein P691DRAFT_813175 [Macrolepiota fuliginosa MF-IS2]